MARISICDFTKEILDKNAEIFEISIDNKTFEIGLNGKTLLLEHLEGEVFTKASSISKPDSNTIGLHTTEDLGIDMPVVGDPFNTEDARIVEPNMGDSPPLEVPTDISQRLKPASIKTVDRVVAESTRFEEGSLPTLSVGGRAQREAAKRLRDLENNEEAKLKRQAGSDINFNKDLR